MTQHLAQLVSKIALAELPRGEWNELLPNLVQSIQMGIEKDGSGDIAASGLVTIGYICEEIVVAHTKRTNEDRCQKYY
jgi:hypothetical protein